jgi:hypothetical protein
MLKDMARLNLTMNDVAVVQIADNPAERDRQIKDLRNT